MVASLEVVFTEADAELYVENINLQSVGQAPDGRTLFNGEPAEAMASIPTSPTSTC